MILRSFSSSIFRCLIVPLTLFASSLEAANRRVVVVSGDPAPEVGPNAQWGSLDAVYVDGPGSLAILGDVLDRTTGESTKVLAYGGQGRHLELLAKSGQSVPVQQSAAAGEPVTLTLSGVDSIQGVAAGQAVIYTDLEGADAGESKGVAILGAETTGLRVIARTGGFVPGTEDTIATLQRRPLMNADGAVTFGVLGSRPDLWRIFRDAPAGVREVYPNGATLPPPKPPSYFGPTPEILATAGGAAVFSGRFATEEGGEADGLMWADANRQVTIARLGDVAPGLPPGWTFYRGMDPVGCTAAGTVLFWSNGRSPTGTVREALWLWDDVNGIQLFAAMGAEIPGSRYSYGPFRDAILNRGGDIAFISGGTLCLKRRGEPVRVVGSPGQYGAFGSNGLHLMADGTLVFGTEYGVFAVGRDSEVQAVLSIRQEITDHQRTLRVSKVSLLASSSGGDEGRRRSVSDEGEIAMIADVSEGTRQHAVIVATLPSTGPQGRRPIASADTVTFRSGAGVPVKIPALANDFDPDGDALKIVAVSDTEAGSARIANGTIVFMPNRTFSGDATIQYTIADADGNTSSADIRLRQPARMRAGSYTTDILNGEEAAGLATLRITDTGRVTGQVRIGGRAYIIRGELNDDGSFYQRLTVEGGLSFFDLSFDFLVDEASGALMLSGTAMARTVVDDGLAADLHYQVASTSAAGLPAGCEPQRVTMQLRALPGQEWPAATGYAVGKLLASGRMILQGRLPDDRPFAAGLMMTRHGAVHLSITPYGRDRGGVTGTLGRQVGGEHGAQWSGQVDWNKAAGAGGSMESVATTLEADVASFAAVKGVPVLAYETAELNRAEFTLDHGAIAIAAEVIMSNADVPTFASLNPHSVRLRVNRATGLMSGSFVPDPLNDKRRVNFQGAVFQPGNEGAGLVLGGAGMSSFRLAPVSLARTAE